MRSILRCCCCRKGSVAVLFSLLAAIVLLWKLIKKQTPELLSNDINDIEQLLKNQSSQVVSQNLTLPSCPETPPALLGAIVVDFNNAPTFAQTFQANYPNIYQGGRSSPTNCNSRHGRVAIVIPFRDRLNHLRALLAHLHPILIRQQIDYQIFVIEQFGSSTFNKALLMNIAFVEALKYSTKNNSLPFDCFIFHDVDMFAEDDRSLHACPLDEIRHMAGFIDKFSYILPYEIISGGVIAIPTKIFRVINGYSNVFFGWGGEDDDLAMRAFARKINRSRYPKEISRYKMYPHVRDAGNPVSDQGVRLFHEGVSRINFDGLNSLPQYEIVQFELLPTHTYLLAKLPSERDVLLSVLSAKSVQ